MSVRSYRDLVVWQRAMDFVEDVYRETRAFPKEEMYGLTGQIRRATVSIASNIAEGQGRGSTRDFLRFLSMANGSLHEVETQLSIAARLGYLDQSPLDGLFVSTAEIGRLLHGLINALNRRLAPQAYDCTDPGI